MINGIATEETRCWVFGSSQPLSSPNPIAEKRLNRFFADWNSHGIPVSGRWRILFDRFLIVLREPEGAEVSGCSIDAMVGEVKLLELELQTSLLDSSRIFLRNDAGDIESISRLEFKARATAGQVTPDTEIFDTTLTRLSDMEVGIFSKPIRDSWHFRIYNQARKSITA